MNQLVARTMLQLIVDQKINVRMCGWEVSMWRSGEVFVYQLGDGVVKDIDINKVKGFILCDLYVEIIYGAAS